MNEFEIKARKLVGKMTLAEKCAQLKYDAPAIERLGVPAYNWWCEALHGVARSGVATVFPQAIAMAASFDDDLLYRVADAISDEARAKYNEYKTFGSTQIYQGLTFWSPNINIFRDPRWGRGHETYGEDPYLTGRMGAAFVRGMQGEGKYHKVDATLKHYAVHSGPEAERHGFDARVSARDLHETYLEAFRYCIEKSHPAAVMGAYNRTNGEPCCASETLIGLLYGELGFDGYYLSDCGAINDINAHHHVTETPAESAALALRAGCVLNCGGAYAHLLAAHGMGLVDEETVTEAAVKLFTARFRLGMFADDCEYDKIGYDVVCCEAHRELNLKMARESVVLLKNDGILPLENSAEGKLAVIGPAADDVDTLLGNYNGTPDSKTTVYEGIRRAYRGRVYYARGCRGYYGVERESTDEDCGERYLRDAMLAADRADVVIMCMGLSPAYEGEEGGFGHGGDKPDISLPEAQRRLFEAVASRGKPIIYINVSGSAIDLREQDEKCPAVLQFFYGGSRGGEAMADIIFGRVSPSGRLPVTFYRSNGDLPPFEDYSMEGRTYRYFRGEPLYAFGHGLSYTSFEYSDLTPVQKPGGADFTVKVKNTGKVCGEDAVLLYIMGRDGVPGEPVKTLAAFRRAALAPGEEAEVYLKTEPGAFMRAGEDGKKRLDPGEYTVSCGALSARVTVSE